MSVGESGQSFGYTHNDLGTHRRKPSYWHYYMMANYCKGTMYLPNEWEDNTGAAIVPSTNDDYLGLKSFAFNAGNYIAVILMNQLAGPVGGGSGTSEAYTIDFDGTAITGGNANFSFPMSMSVTRSGTIDYKSTYLLFFSCNGTYMGEYRLREQDMIDDFPSYDLLTGHYTTGSSSIPPTFLTAEPSPASCIGSNSSNVTLNLTGGVTKWYQLPERNEILDGQGLSPGFYEVTVDVDGSTTTCSAASTVFSVHEYSPYVDAGADRIACGASPSTVLGNSDLPTSSQTYVWTTGGSSTSLSSSTTYDPGVTTGQTTTYTITATAGGSCKISDEASIIDNAGPDLFVKDTPADDGSQPSANGIYNLVLGTDVWVRNKPAAPLGATPARYTNEHQHENVEYNADWDTDASKRPRIYVKVRNRSCTTSVARVRIYYHKFASSDKWASPAAVGTNVYGGNWEEVLINDNDGNGLIDGGSCGDSNSNGVIDGLETSTCNNTITLGPGEEGVIEQVWNSTANNSVFFAPNGTRNDQWCLLVRIDDGTSNYMEDNSGLSSAGLNAWNSNNIVQKNVVFVNEHAGFVSFPFEFGNSTAGTTINRLDGWDENSFVGAKGEIYLKLDSALYYSWSLGGKQGDGFLDGREKYTHRSSVGNIHTHDPLKTDVNPYQIRLTNDSSSLRNISLAANALKPIDVSFNFYPGSFANTKSGYGFEQHDTSKYRGAVHYFMLQPECPQVSITGTTTIDQNCSTTLTTSPSTAGATYTWRKNSTGVTVDTGASIMVYPFVTTAYEVEMRMPNGCVSYAVDTVVVDDEEQCRLDCTEATYDNDTLEGNTTISSRTTISNYLTVPSGVTLQILSTEVGFNYRAGIRVLQGGRLHIENSDLHACEVSWQGITVTGNNTDTFQLFVKECKITHATTPLDMTQVVQAVVNRNMLAYGVTGISMNNCLDFEINRNQLYSFTTGIDAFNNGSATNPYITENYFLNQTKAIQLQNGNFLALDINCNVFDSYSSYGIYCNSANLQSQGTTTAGAGNLFVSTSSATNHQLRYNGTSMNYYYDPSDTVALSTSGGLTAVSGMASTNRGCTEVGNYRMNRPENVEVVHGESGNQEIFSPALDAFPNPASDRVIYTYKIKPDAKRSEILLRDLYGKILTRYLLLPGTRAIETDCSSLSNGIYFYSLICDGQIVETKKVVIAR